ncbi:hypothetical protein EDB89DRAFT_1900227 [Lactarius sanguifluus]|nr:hypothetical protein EDB89DRAFT_1900227 [Lactarius sanguifluus]
MLGGVARGVRAAAAALMVGRGGGVRVGRVEVVTAGGRRGRGVAAVGHNAGGGVASVSRDGGSPHGLATKRKKNDTTQLWWWRGGLCAHKLSESFVLAKEEVEEVAESGGSVGWNLNKLWVAKWHISPCHKLNFSPEVAQIAIFYPSQFE